MKKNFLLLFACIPAFFSCKKGADGTSNTLMIGEVYRNNLLDAKYIYDTELQLVRFNEYGIANGQSVLAIYATYEYGTDGYIRHRKVFAKNDTLNNRYEYNFDNAGRLSRMDWFFPGSNLYQYRLYEYNQQNQVTKISEKQGGTNNNLGYTEYAYDNNGQLKFQQRFIWLSNAWKKAYTYEYIPAGKNVYGHWQKFMASPFDMFWSELNMASKHVTTYDLNENVESVYIDSATNKQYNGSGFLTKQRITRKYTQPVKPDEAWEMQYDYVQ